MFMAVYIVCTNVMHCHAEMYHFSGIFYIKQYIYIYSSLQFPSQLRDKVFPRVVPLE